MERCQQKKGKDVEDGGESRYAVWIRDRQVVELQLQQMKMLRVSVGVMRMESEGQHTLDVLEAKSESSEEGQSAEGC